MLRLYTTNTILLYYPYEILWLPHHILTTFNWTLWTWEICVMQMRCNYIPLSWCWNAFCQWTVYQIKNIFYHTCRSFFNRFLSRSIRHLYHWLGCPNVTARSSRAVTLKSRPKLCQHCRHRQTVHVWGSESMSTCILQGPRRTIRNTWNQQHWIVHDMSTTAWVDTVLTVWMVNVTNGKLLGMLKMPWVHVVEIRPRLASVKIIRADLQTRVVTF